VGADELREALATVLGVRAVVAKARRLFVLEGVRIHLDRVDGLGSFIELEGVVGADGSGDLARFEGLLPRLRRAFDIGDDDLLAASYSDLVPAPART
jgi:adenylate cyclase, class 2